MNHPKLQTKVKIQWMILDESVFTLYCPVYLSWALMTIWANIDTELRP